MKYFVLGFAFLVIALTPKTSLAVLLIGSPTEEGFVSAYTLVPDSGEELDRTRALGTTLGAAIGIQYGELYSFEEPVFLDSNTRAADWRVYQLETNLGADLVKAHNLKAIYVPTTFWDFFVGAEVLKRVESLKEKIGEDAVFSEEKVDLDPLLRDIVELGEFKSPAISRVNKEKFITFELQVKSILAHVTRTFHNMFISYLNDNYPKWDIEDFDFNEVTENLKDELKNLPSKENSGILNVKKSMTYVTLYGRIFSRRFLLKYRLPKIWSF